MGTGRRNTPGDPTLGQVLGRELPATRLRRSRLSSSAAFSALAEMAPMPKKPWTRSGYSRRTVGTPAAGVRRRRPGSGCRRRRPTSAPGCRTARRTSRTRPRRRPGRRSRTAGSRTRRPAGRCPADRPDERPDQRRGAERADQEHRLAADPVAQQRPGRDGAQRDQVGRDDHPQQAALGQAHRLGPVGEGVDAEDRADDRDQRGEQHLEHVGGVAAEQRLQRCGGHRVVVALLLERRALVQGPPDPPADDDHDGAEQERDPPAPGQQLLLRAARRSGGRPRWPGCCRPGCRRG